MKLLVDRLTDPRVICATLISIALVVCSVILKPKELHRSNESQFLYHVRENRGFVQVWKINKKNGDAERLNTGVDSRRPEQVLNTGWRKVLLRNSIDKVDPLKELQ